MPSHDEKPKGPKPGADIKPGTHDTVKPKPRIQPNLMLPAPKPTRVLFDPWNSVGAGHQRSENNISSSTSWRASRTRKLNAQFSAGLASGGGERMYDTVGAGSRDWGKGEKKANSEWRSSDVSGNIRGDKWGDLQTWIGASEDRSETKRRAKKLKIDNEEERICAPDREKSIRRWESTSPPPSAQVQRSSGSKDQDVPEFGPPSSSPPRKHKSSSRYSLQPAPNPAGAGRTSEHSPPSHQPARPTPPGPSPENLSSRKHFDLPETINSEADVLSISAILDLPPSQIFRSLNFHILGSTYPAISDHALKHLLSAHGGNISIALAKRTVTHVIIGGGESGGGALAGGKMQREIDRVRGKGLKFVGVEWVLESLRKGKRVPEADFRVDIDGRGSVEKERGGVLGGGVGQRSAFDFLTKDRRCRKGNG